ncbi:hypothetical protein PQR02_20475 [Paraburkholderia sediminicola]|uniref:Uncharacterized protein n=1 Tax=Paraburkholderia rhynchosiae TaxID=487049 RepID=A0ACC7NQN8_9BURK
MYHVGIWILGVGLVFFHVLCYVRRNQWSPQLPKIIDYQYVATGAIGLVLAGATVSLDQKMWDREHRDAVSLSRNQFEWFQYQVAMSQRDLCAVDADGQRCLDTKALSARVESKMTEINKADDTAVLVAAMAELSAYASTLKNLSWKVRDSAADYAARVKDLTDLPPRPGSSDDAYDPWKLLAAIFLPSAAALRLTKITVEICHWYPSE